MAISELRQFTEYAIKKQAANIAAAFEKYEKIQNDSNESDFAKQCARDRFYEHFVAYVQSEERNWISRKVIINCKGGGNNE
jgi:hypothetical protein